MDERPAALSIRRGAIEYGLSRDTIAAALQRGEIPHRRLGRRAVMLREDIERWIRGGDPVRPTAHAEDVVQRRLEREERATTP